MPINYTSNNFLSNQGLNINPISSENYLNLNDDYSLRLSGRSSFNPVVNNLETDTVEPFTMTNAAASGKYSYTSGYGLINAAAAVAKAAGQNTFADVPALDGNNWGADLVKAPEAWAKGYTGKGVVVAVLDSGVDYTHPDLKDNIWTNPNPGNGKDNGDGYINDIHGWNFVDNNNDVLDKFSLGHGTHVAGTIAGENNGFGVTGIAYDAKIMPVKVLDNSGAGTDASITKGIHYAVDHGANVINLSLGGGSADNSLESAIQYASSKNVVVVMAAGNESGIAPSYPGRYAKNSGLAVGAVDQNKNMPDFSNRAGFNQLAYVTAPGVNIYSTIPDNKYASYRGTSMATPHVAGVVALMLSANHNLTDSQVRQIATQTAENSTQAAKVSPTINSMIASTSFRTKPVIESMIASTSFRTKPVIESMIASTSFSAKPITKSNDMFVNSNIGSQFLSYYQNTLGDNSHYSISGDDETDADNIVKKRETLV